MRFGTKYVEIDAIQFHGAENRQEVCDWVKANGGELLSSTSIGDAMLVIPTLEGSMVAKPGSWIIRGLKGEFYPCDPEIFAAKYVPVVEGQKAPLSWEDYQQGCLKTESVIEQSTEIDLVLFTAVLNLVSHAGQILNLLKRHYFYKLPMDFVKLNECVDSVTFERNIIEGYAQGKAPSIKNSIAIDLRLVHGIVGMCTESAELSERLSSILRKPMLTEADRLNFFEECGDQLWYLAITLDKLGFKLPDVLQRNLDKLKARHGDKFSPTGVVERDLEKEQAVLRGEAPVS